jgi:hypothetical protein
MDITRRPRILSKPWESGGRRTGRWGNEGVGSKVLSKNVRQLGSRMQTGEAARELGGNAARNEEVTREQVGDRVGRQRWSRNERALPKGEGESG